MNEASYLRYSAMPFPELDPSSVSEEVYFEFLHLDADVAGWYAKGEISIEMKSYFQSRILRILENLPEGNESAFKKYVLLLLESIGVD